MLSEYEQKKFNTIEKLENGELTRKEVAYELNLSLKQIDRLRKKYHIQKANVVLPIRIVVKKIQIK